VGIIYSRDCEASIIKVRGGLRIILEVPAWRNARRAGGLAQKLCGLLQAFACSAKNWAGYGYCISQLFTLFQRETMLGGRDK